MEVTRVRIASNDEDAAERRLNEARRLVETAGNKLNQLLPNAPNVVAIAAPNLVASEADFAAEMENLRRRAERSDSAAMTRHAFGNASNFLKSYERLSR